jgi:hypothetical protein
MGLPRADINLDEALALAERLDDVGLVHKLEARKQRAWINLRMSLPWWIMSLSRNLCVAVYSSFKLLAF